MQLRLRNRFVDNYSLVNSPVASLIHSFHTVILLFVPWPCLGCRYLKQTQRFPPLSRILPCASYVPSAASVPPKVNNSLLFNPVSIDWAPLEELGSGFFEVSSSSTALAAALEYSFSFEELVSAFAALDVDDSGMSSPMSPDHLRLLRI